MMFPGHLTEILTRVNRLAEILPQIVTIGVSGSYAQQQNDALSDVDFCLWGDFNGMSASFRKARYHEVLMDDVLYFDVHFPLCIGDGIMLDDMRCDFLWYELQAIQTFLATLETDFLGHEGLPGALSHMQPLYDPHNMIAALQAQIPLYSDERAQYRVQHGMTRAHHAVYRLRWLEKAVFRQDYVSFLKYTYELLETLFCVWFALNHIWYSDEKRLTARIATFEFLPSQAAERIQAIILHHDEIHELTNNFEALKELCRDSVQCIHQRYPDLEVPQSWP